MYKQIIPVLLVNPTHSLQNASGINVLLKHVLLVIHVAAHVQIFASSETGGMCSYKVNTASTPTRDLQDLISIFLLFVTLPFKLVYVFLEIK